MTGKCDLTCLPLQFPNFIPENADKLTLDFFLPDKYIAMAQGAITSSLGNKLADKMSVMYTNKSVDSDKKDDGARIAKMFSVIQGSMTPELVQSTQAVYAFKVKGIQTCF